MYVSTYIYNWLVWYVIINDDNWMIYHLLLYKHCPASVFLPFNWVATTAMCLHHGVMCQQIAARLSCLLVGELYLGLWVKHTSSTALRQPRVQRLAGHVSIFLTFAARSSQRAIINPLVPFVLERVKFWLNLINCKENVMFGKVILEKFHIVPLYL